MSLFPRAFSGYDTSASFHPLFRLLDDFDNYSKSSGGNSQVQQQRTSVPTFAPKFDVKETPEAYELHGELPGIDQTHVEIEFTDPATIAIRGRVERSYTAGTPPSGAIEDQKNGGSITDGNAHKATVEDEGAAEKTKSTEVTPSQNKQPEEKEKYWVTERSVGEFARAFSFPTRVDQAAVKASMKNGILTIIVPKAKKHDNIKIPVIVE